MEKSDIVAAFGQVGLLGPVRMTAALVANDRLKLALTALQATASHAAAPETLPADLRKDYAAAQMDAPWLLDMVGSGTASDGVLKAPELRRLGKLLSEDLAVMVRPLEGRTEGDAVTLADRAAHWTEWLTRLEGGTLDATDLGALTGGKRGSEDTFHILVMDLHKVLNRIAADLADEEIDGAHVWQIEPADRPRIKAFMRGLDRTRARKFDHPGLETAATHDGSRLLLQNDIGTNDAHVLVVAVEGLSMTLTYSDLHKSRFAFFQGLLCDIGAVWSEIDARNTAGLNDGEDYISGTARFDCADDAALLSALEGLGARIVFLIDWNRARKRLNLLVAKPVSVAVLTAAAKDEVGHMGWLLAGGADLVFGAMEALGPEHFRIGDRLDAVMGQAEAEEFLRAVMKMCADGLQARQGVAQIADQTRLLLSRHMARHVDAFAALEEHAAFCHALAEALRDALAHGLEQDGTAAMSLSARAKGWERAADHQVMLLRDETGRNAHRLPFLRLIEGADDAADALEEAAFLLSLIAQGHASGWTGDLRTKLLQLASKVLEATQDHVKSLAIARSLNDVSSADDQTDFLTACWRVMAAERLCDVLMREVRGLLVRDIKDAATLSLTTDFAAALEASTDALLRNSYALRDQVLTRWTIPLKGAVA